jgi:hypothetical protein
LKKDPYKQSIDILNKAPFVNLRSGEDKSSVNSAIASSSNSTTEEKTSDAKYTQKQFDVAVRMASHDSAEMALAKYKQVQNEEKHEKNQLKKEIK